MFAANTTIPLRFPASLLSKCLGKAAVPIQPFARQPLCQPSRLENTCDMLLDRGMMGDGVADLKGIRAEVEDAGYCGHARSRCFWRVTGGCEMRTRFWTK